MGLPIGQLVLGASRARNAFVGGQKEREHDDLAQALMARKMERETQEQSLRDALTRSQTSHNDALSASLRAPKQDEWDRFETADGWVEQNKRTREVRPINAPNAPPAPVQAGAPSVAPTGGPSRIDEITGDDIPTRGFEAPQTPTLPTGPLTQSRQLQPKPSNPPAPDRELVPIMRNGKRILVPRAEAVGQESPAPAGPAPDRTVVAIQTPNGPKYVTREEALGQAPAIAGQGARPTEEQDKSYKFYGLMKNAEPTIQAAMKSGNIRPEAVQAYLLAQNASTIPLLGKVIGAAAGPLVNSKLNADEQRLIRAAADFTAGVKRKESGQAVSASEILEIAGRYVPGMLGDTPELTQDKQTAREQYMEDMRQMSASAAEYYAKHGGAGGGGDKEAAWAAKNPPKKGESFEAYHQRFLKSGGD